MGAAAGIEVESPADREERDRRNARDTFWATMVAVLVVASSYWLLLLRPSDGGSSYRRIITTLQFAGSQVRLAGRLDGVSIGEARLAVVSSLGFAIVWGVAGSVLLWGWWRKAWKTGPGTKLDGRRLGLALAAGGASVATVEKLVTLAAIESEDSGIGFVDSPWSILPKIIVTLAWIKWLLAGILICVVVAMAVSATTAFVRRRLPEPQKDLPDDPVHEPDQEVPIADPTGTGISCSGGGIRAAGFALGCLAKLEEPMGAAPGPTASDRLGILGRASYLASVSGGGYAAAAWRIAAGPDELPASPIIGNPLDAERDDKLRAHGEANDGAMDLLQHIRERRHYLANGPGGLLRSAVRAVGSTAFHFLLVLLTVLVVAWPLGRILVSWAVTGVGRGPEVLSEGLANDSVGVHQWLPPVALAAVVLAAMIVRFGAEKDTRRTVVDLVIKLAAGMALALFVVLIGLPWLVDRFVRFLPDSGGDQFAVAGIYGTALTAAWQFASARLRPRARYLGGWMLAIGLVLFGLYVMASAADTDEVLSSAWVWVTALLFLMVAFVLFNPDRWSLHSIYRDGLAGTFATERRDGGVHPMSPRAEPSLAAYRGAEGPAPVICCAAARDDNRETGIKVLSMTFDPDWITVHGWQGKGIGASYRPNRISHAQFQRRLPRSTFGVGLHTLMGTAAISGAAVAPSLGRLDMRSTNALLAAFNARLGVWMPNPTQSYTRSTTPRLVNMFKEIGQLFGEDDPNVYATDGGHWENLGLVELVRRRCSTIICIDASGDPPGTYQTFKNAVELARLECEATIALTDQAGEDLAVTDGGRPATNFGTGTITYQDGKEATLLYVKATVAETSPIHIRRYASSDRRFPDYSTGDQLLEDDEFNYLIQLGYHSMGEALAANEDLVDAIMSGP